MVLATMLLEFSDEKVIIKEITVKSILAVQNGGRIDEILPSLIVCWSLPTEVNLQNILKIKKNIAMTIYREARKSYDILRNIEPIKLAAFLKTTIRKNNGEKIYFSGFEPSEITVMRECMEIKNTLFDMKGNMIHYPEQGGYLDQNAKYMHFLQIYQEKLREYYRTQ